MGLFDRLLKIPEKYKEEIIGYNKISESAKALDPSETNYRGASKMVRSLRAWLPFANPPQKDFPKHERETLVARSRDAYRNHLIARAVIGRARTNVIGRGLRLRSAINYESLGISQEEASALGDTIESEFRLWSDDPEECDAEGHNTFYQLQSLAFLTSLLSGECFVMLNRDRRRNGYPLKIQLIEPDRVCSPVGKFSETIIDGIEKDRFGKTVAIWVADINEYSSWPATWRRIPVYSRDGKRQILHIMGDKERPGQVRGVPFLAPIMENLLRIEQYTNAELTAASINAMLTVFLEKDMPSDEEPFEVDQSGAISLGNGAIVDLAPGERANMVDPTRPNVNFNNFVISIIRQIGAALEIPGDEILLHYDSSYSAARAVMLEAWKFYLTRREYFADQFCRRIYSEWLDDAVELDRVNLPGYNQDYATRRKYQQSRWIGPARGAIDELKEAQAAELRINIGVSSIAREAAAMSGDDWDTIHRELVYEQRARMEGGLIE